MSECGDLIWWCEGQEGPVGKPEIRMLVGDEPDIIHEQDGGQLILNAYVFCTGCGRMAPEGNGCRYVLRSEVEEGEPLCGYEGMDFA